MTSSQKWDFFCLFKPVEPDADWLCFAFLLFLSHSHPHMTSWDCSGRIPHFLTLETDHPIPHKSFTNLLVYWESSMAIMLTLVSFIMDVIPPQHKESAQTKPWWYMLLLAEWRPLCAVLLSTLLLHPSIYGILEEEPGMSWRKRIVGVFP